MTDRERDQHIARLRVLGAVRKINRLLPQTGTDPVVVAQVQTLLRAIAAHLGLRDEE